MWTPPLRESFSYPFLVFQLLAVTLTIKYVNQVCIWLILDFTFSVRSHMHTPGITCIKSCSLGMQLMCTSFILYTCRNKISAWPVSCDHIMWTWFKLTADQVLGFDWITGSSEGHCLVVIRAGFFRSQLIWARIKSV